MTMKTRYTYYDGQAVHIGDVFANGSTGTCRFTGFDKLGNAVFHNLANDGTLKDLDPTRTFHESDLVSRDPEGVFDPSKAGPLLNPAPVPVALQTPDEWLATHVTPPVAASFVMTRQWKEGRTNHTSQCQDAVDARLPVNAVAFERYTKAPTDKEWRLKNTAGYVKTGETYVYKGE